MLVFIIFMAKTAKSRMRSMDLGYIHSIKKNIKKFFKNSTKKKLIMI